MNENVHMLFLQVFTAHPTQAMRQSLLKKYAKVRTEMDRLHNTRMSPYERLECLEEMRSQIQAAWRTDEIRRKKPTPQDEMRQGLTYVHGAPNVVTEFFARQSEGACTHTPQALPPEGPGSFGQCL